MRPVRSMRSSLAAFTALSLVLGAASVLPAAAQSQLPRPGQLPPAGGPQGAPQQGAPQRPGGPQAAPQQQQQPAAAPIKPYQPLTITLPAPTTDPSFDAFRKQLADVANRKDRAGLTKLVVAQGFFWEGENGDKADKKKSSVDNLGAAMGGFTGRDAQAWESLAAAAQDPTLEPLPDHNGVMCGPAGPKLDEAAFEALTKATGTDAGDWAFPVTPNLEVRSAAQPNAPVVEKLGMHLVRVMADPAPPNAQQAPPPFARVVTPSGRTGFVAMESISPLGFDQICYVKDATGWKITGYAAAD